MAPKPFPDLLADLRANPNDEGVLRNVLSDLKDHGDYPLRDLANRLEERLAGGPPQNDADRRRAYVAPIRAEVEDELVSRLGAPLAAARAMPVRLAGPLRIGGRRTQSKKFGSCVKAVRKTVKVRKGSNPESAAIAICTKSMLFPRGRTIKRYKKGRLTTQKRRI